MARQKDYSLSSARRRLQRRTNLYVLATRSNMSFLMKRNLLLGLRKAEKDVENVVRRLRHIQGNPFNLNTYSEEQCLHDFRFKSHDIFRISKTIGWNRSATKRNRYQCDAITATCIIMKRLSCAHTWYDMEYMFGMRYSHVSEAFWEAVECFVERKGFLITNLQVSMLRDRVAMYAKAIRDRGAPLHHCIGFIDCTKIEMCRPGGSPDNQRACFSGHTRKHCLKYLTISTPDGLIFYLFGPGMGRRHDLTVLRMSGLEMDMERGLRLDGTQYYVYGDQIFCLRPWLQVAFANYAASKEQKSYNNAMNKLRTAVEWNYRDLKRLWKRNAFSRLLCVRRFPVALLYIASGLLLNFKVCIEKGGQAGTYFNCEAPNFDTYCAAYEAKRSARSSLRLA